MAFVLDASVALAWCFADERTAYTRSLLRELQRTTAVAPAIWQLEVSNGLLAGERRRRLTEAQTDSLLRLLSGLPVAIDTQSPPHGFALMSLARKQTLSTYDVSYLELAMRLNLPLATKDRRLRAAARSVGVALAQPSR